MITEAGLHDRVAGLVYIAAFAPDAGESVSTLIADPPPGAPVPPILPPQDGFLFLDREKFAESFAADLPAGDDRMIPPPAQRAMSERAGATVVEAPGSHSIYISQPQATAGLIKRAAQEALTATPSAV